MDMPSVRVDVSAQRALAALGEVECLHRDLFAQVHRFQQAIDAGAAQAEIVAAFMSTHTQARRCFAAEDQLLQSYAFGGTRSHLAAHRAIERELLAQGDALVRAGARERGGWLHALDGLVVHHLRDDHVFAQGADRASAPAPELAARPLGSWALVPPYRTA